jgi:hypothetical protein
MNSKNRLIVNATGINSFGGRRVLEVFKKFKVEKFYNNIKEINYGLFSSYFHKIYLDFYFYFTIKCEKTSIVYLSGTPPIIRNKAFIQSCFQNSNIFFKNSNVNFFIWLFSLNSLRFFFFKLFHNNVDQWIVFSELSKNILMNNNIKDYKIKVVDLFNIEKTLIEYNNLKRLNLRKKYKRYTLIYPADNLYHKNHVNLFIALKILAKSNIYPRVLLTLDIKKNSKFVKLKKLYNLNVDFKVLKRKDMTYAYKNSDALIYPSLNETVGLPIYEALRYNLTIIASNLPYVNQFIKSDLLFDPLDPIDIADKINFFLSKKKFSFSLLPNNICITSKEFSKIF